MLTRNARHPGIVPRQPPLPPRRADEIITDAEIVHVEFVERPPVATKQPPKKRRGIQPPDKSAAKALDQIIGEPPAKQGKKPAKKKRTQAPKQTAAQTRARKPRRYDAFGEWQFMTCADNHVMARHPNGTVTAMPARRWYAMSKTPVLTLAERIAMAAREIGAAFERQAMTTKLEMVK